MSDSKNPVGRRGFLKRAAAGGAGLAATAPIALAQQAALKPATGSAAEVTSSVRPGSDFMVESQREMMYLGKKPNVILDSAEFKAMKTALTAVTAKAAEESKDKPSLLAPEQGCPALTKLIYEPDQPIEAICAAPQTKLTAHTGH